MGTLNAVIETATGDLLRVGYSDFENDGSFDGGTETFFADIPPAIIKIRGVLGALKMNRWTGSEWVEVDQIDVPVGGDLGYTLVWGANMQTTGRYAQVNGITSGGQETGLSPGSEYIVPADGTLDCLTYNSGTGDNTTVFKIWKNGAVEHTFTATGAGDFESGIGLSVVAGDLIAVEYDAGQKPAGSVYVAYIN